MSARAGGMRRRSLLLGGAALGAAASAAAATGAYAFDRAVAARPLAYAFHGPHQAGILTPQQAHATFAAFDTTARSRDELRELFATITDRARFLTSGGEPAPIEVTQPPSDSATIGPIVPADGLTVTLGVGSSLFDGRYGLDTRRPASLERMPVFANDHVDGSTELHGDLLLQICADSRDVVMHALRDIAKHTRAGMQPRWKADGFQSTPRPSGAPRNQLGFKDGIANPDVRRPDLARTLLWARGGGREPAWVEGGAYQVVRIIRMLVEFWDRVSLHEQEAMIGRRRDTGAPLGMSAESDIPSYADDPNGLRVPLGAHIRLANPRTPDTAHEQILRRGYNYERGLDANGDLDVGLIFCCYQQDVRRQFQAIQERLADEALVDYVQPTGGGYFFVLPGVRGVHDHLGSALLA